MIPKHKDSAGLKGVYQWFFDIFPILFPASCFKFPAGG